MQLVDRFWRSASFAFEPRFPIVDHQVAQPMIPLRGNPQVNGHQHAQRIEPTWVSQING